MSRAPHYLQVEVAIEEIEQLASCPNLTQRIEMLEDVRAELDEHLAFARSMQASPATPEAAS